MPAMGVELEIEEIERRETGENAKTPGCRAYNASYRIVAPEAYKDRRVFEFFTIGTKDDPKAKRDETWDRPEQGPGRLIRMLEKAGVPITDDDEDWMEAAQGHKVYAHLTLRPDNRTGSMRNEIGLYFEDGDEDFVGVGEELEARPSGGKKKARGGATKEREEETRRSARGKRREDDDEADEKDDDDVPEDEDDDEPKGKKKNGKGKRDDDDEEDDAPKRKRAARGRQDDDDDD